MRSPRDGSPILYRLFGPWHGRTSIPIEDMQFLYYKTTSTFNWRRMVFTLERLVCWEKLVTLMHPQSNGEAMSLYLKELPIWLGRHCALTLSSPQLKKKALNHTGAIPSSKSNAEGMAPTLGSLVLMPVVLRKEYGKASTAQAAASTHRAKANNEEIHTCYSPKLSTSYVHVWEEQ